MKKNVLNWLGHVEQMSDEREEKRFTGEMSRKKHQDPPKGMYKKIYDSGRGERGERGMQRLQLLTFRSL